MGKIGRHKEPLSTPASSDHAVEVRLEHASIAIPSAANATTLKQALLQRNAPQQTLTILDDVNLQCQAGEHIGIIGHNGSGKSSLLRAIAGIYPLTSGTLTCHGTISANLEKGSGLDMELNLRQNIELGLAVSNRLHHHSAQQEAWILHYAELTEFADQPLKILSTGMRTRLAFALSMVGEADILLLDEVFATGDARYIEKSLTAMHDRIQDSALMFLVSHQMDRIRETCNRVLLMDHGRLIADGPCEEVIKAYVQRNQAGR
ncbi:ABC transporter ATP-binding protein [Magnetococcus sp. PR-3]|uniref:ABC transporter ATP-binding protein n=1 Tax=Magnetococcus sp. PR-3 TaxID=3120355 RepID=UPI002FCE2551